jgi:hypothetical protein
MYTNHADQGKREGGVKSKRVVGKRGNEKIGGKGKDMGRRENRRDGGII